MIASKLYLSSARLLRTPSIVQRVSLINNAQRNFASDSSGYAHGTVKFYLRDKAYGFIIADDPIQGASELWVHRSSFDTEHSPEQYPTRPYLLKNERVKFRVEEAADSSQSHKAIDVVFENGRQVPLFRKNYHASVTRGEMQRLGEAVMQVLSDNELSETVQLERIKAAAQAASDVIANAEQLQKEHGPEVNKSS